MAELKDYQSVLNEKAARVEKIFERYDFAAPFATEFADLNAQKIKKVEPQIMMYGIYNAGKSSIINELIGADRAKVADVPTTDRVDYYEWQGYKIFDTPGVFAPIAHEEVTERDIKKADIVLFVISGKGPFDRIENYRRMKIIAESGKKIIIVLNDMDGYMGKNEEALREIKQKVAVNMQQVGIEDVDEKYCIVTVNALRAKMGRTKNKPVLIEKSGLPELKDVILSELKRTTSFDVLRQGIKQIEGVLDRFIRELEGRGDSEALQKMNGVLETFSRQKLSMRRQLNLFIDMRAERLGETLPQMIWENRSRQSEIDRLIATEVGKLNKSVQDEMSRQLTEIASILEQEIKAFESVKLDAQSTDAASFKAILDRLSKVGSTEIQTGSSVAVPTPTLDAETVLTAAATTAATTGLATSIATAGVQELGKQFVKTEVGSMLAKTALGKMASSVIPIVGPVITVVSTLKTLFDLFGGGDDREKMEAANAARNEAARRRMEAEMQARQELNQKCRYMADKLSDELKAATSKSLDVVLEQYEAPFKEQIAQRKDAGARAAADAAQLRSLREEYDQLRVELGAR